VAGGGGEEGEVFPFKKVFLYVKKHTPDPKRLLTPPQPPPPLPPLRREKMHPRPKRALDMIF